MAKVNSIFVAFILLFTTAVVYAADHAEHRAQSPASFVTAKAHAADNSKYISQSPAGAELYFISPQDGQVVSKTFAVKFGLRGMGISPAGLDKNGTGHHHILVDLKKLPDLTQPLATNDNIRHFGSGQSETTLTLSPGEHTLQLLLGNYLHIPHSPVVISKKIKVIVK